MVTGSRPTVPRTATPVPAHTDVPQPTAAPPTAADDELASWDALATAEAIRTGTISPVEAVAAAITETAGRPDHVVLT